jgi:UDP-glucose 6-dehydrogenase
MIGIAGFGFVGGALYNSVKDKESVIIYDPGFEEYSDRVDLLETDVIFICVPTPFNSGKMDASAGDINLEFLSTSNYTGLVVIKSTIHPQYLNEKWTSNLKMLSNPEFLNEHTAVEDFKNQTLVIIGGRFDLAEQLKQIYTHYFDINPNAEYEFMSFYEALIFKYIRNIKTAYEVMFWEFVNDTTGNYRKYNKILDKLPVKVTNICTDGDRGFGGRCLPKDTAAYPNHVLTDFLLMYNKMIR